MKWNPKNKVWYESKGYVFTNWKEEFEVKVEDLPHGSVYKVDGYCDNCNKPIKSKWQDFLKHVKEDGKIYCHSCALELYGINKSKTTHLKLSTTFGEWLINTYGDDALSLYWSDKNIINSNEISFKSQTKVWIKCQEKDYHDDYDIRCKDFVNGDRCPYCHGLRVNRLDSLGYLYPDSLKYWSDKNKKSPYEYTPHSQQETWWKCPNGKHEDFKRSISNSNRYNFRCPSCDYSKGESSIDNYLVSMGLYGCSETQFNNISNSKIDYISQKTFDGLLGLGYGNLSYDFYLPDYNLLIEYQGEQHEHYIKGFHKSKKDFEKQVEHDKLKRDYAINHNIKLLAIWYYDYDNIDKILDKELIMKEEI